MLSLSMSRFRSFLTFVVVAAISYFCLLLTFAFNHPIKMMVIFLLTLYCLTFNFCSSSNPFFLRVRDRIKPSIFFSSLHTKCSVPNFSGGREREREKNAKPKATSNKSFNNVEFKNTTIERDGNEKKEK